jgi:hypothetical protein
MYVFQIQRDAHTIHEGSSNFQIGGNRKAKRADAVKLNLKFLPFFNSRRLGF